MNRKELKSKAKAILKIHFKEILVLVFLVALINIDFFGLGAEARYNSSADIETVICYVKIFSFEIGLAPTSAMLSLVGIYTVFKAIYDLFVGIPLQFGYSNKIKHYAMGKNEDFHLFDGFKYYYKKAIILNIIVYIKIFLYTLLLIIPGIIKAFEYLFVNEILEEHPEWSYKEIMEESARLTDGHKWELFKLGFSFIFWILLGVIISFFTLGLGVYLIVPYMDLTFANAYVWLKDMDGAESYEQLQNENTFENLPFE